MAVMFAGVFLLDAGLANAQIGLVLAAGSAASALLQPTIAGAAGRSTRVPLRMWIAAFAAGMAALAALLIVPGLPWLATALLFASIVFVVQSAQSLVTGVGMAAIHDGVPVNFGVARAVGSLTFAVLSLAAGWLVAASGAVAVPLILLAAAVVMAGSAATFVVRPRTVRGQAAQPHAGSSPQQGPAARPRRFMWLVAGMTLSMTSHNLINSYLFQIISFHGGGSGEMGVAVMIAAVVELPTLILWAWIARRWSPGLLLQVSAAFFAVKSAATWWAAGIGALYAAQLLQFMAFALLVPASIYYVHSLFPPGERVKGQAYMTVAPTSAGVIGGLAGGVMLDALGVPTMLMVGTVVAVIGTLVTSASVVKVPPVRPAASSR